ncbi:hypothetical protein ABEF95_002280 [Exophiala dermatitidis]
MCVRTKTSYGCGCEFKTTVECHSSRCQGLERYHYPREGDCRACKLGGQEVTRGREGKGRYAQELSKNSSMGAISRLSGEGHPSCPLDIGGGISPWAAPTKREKEWHSPSRKKADEAWLQEHVERNSDLQTIRESASTISASPPPSTAAQQPDRRARAAKVYELGEPQSYNEFDEYIERPHRRELTEAPVQVEVRSAPDHAIRLSRRPVHQRRRHDSQESFGSLRSSQSSSRRYRLASGAYTAYDPVEPCDSGYGSYGTPACNVYEVAKTEPYNYSTAPRTVSVKPSSTASYGVYQTGFGIGGVDIVSRTPLYAYSTRRL